MALLMTIDDGGAHYRSAGTGLARWFLTFDGGFDLVELPGGRLRRWRQADVEAEMLRLQLIEAEQRGAVAD